MYAHVSFLLKQRNLCLIAKTDMMTIINFHFSLTDAYSIDSVSCGKIREEFILQFLDSSVKTSTLLLAPWKDGPFP